MFRRLVFENSAALFTIAAFLTAVSIYLSIAWRALRMKRPQVAHFSHLPFEVDTPVAQHVSAHRRQPGGDSPRDQSLKV